MQDSHIDLCPHSDDHDEAHHHNDSEDEENVTKEKALWISSSTGELLVIDDETKWITQHRVGLSIFTVLISEPAYANIFGIQLNFDFVVHTVSTVLILHFILSTKAVWRYCLSI